MRVTIPCSSITVEVGTMPPEDRIGASVLLHGVSVSPDFPIEVGHRITLDELAVQLGSHDAAGIALSALEKVAKDIERFTHDTAARTERFFRNAHKLASPLMELVVATPCSCTDSACQRCLGERALEEADPDARERMKAMREWRGGADAE